MTPTSIAKPGSQTRQKRSSQPADRASRVRRLLFHPTVLILMVFGVSATVVGPLLFPTLPELSERPEYRLEMSDIEITEPPYWVPNDLVQQVIERAGLPQSACVLNDTLAQQVSEAFQREPWVAEVVFVRKSFPARVHVELKYRVPVAMVQVKEGIYPIDGQGVLLPPADFSATATQQYPLIENASTLPQGPSGAEWGDPTVCGAAHLAEVLTPYWEAFHLKAIRIPRKTTAKVTLENVIYQVVTREGTSIVWGRAPGTDYPGELTAFQKIGRLEKYLADFGAFDSPNGPYEIDIRHWQEISRRPLTSGRERIRR